VRKTAGRAGRVARRLTARQRPIVQRNVLFNRISTHLLKVGLPGCLLSTAPHFQVWLPASKVWQCMRTVYFYMKFRGHGFSCRVLLTVSRLDYISISIVRLDTKSVL
jgi:hypothetical protein